MEIIELRAMAKHAAYFTGFDALSLLPDYLEEAQKDAKYFLSGYFKELESADLSTVQELLLLEVILRIIHADDRIDENEILFMQLVRSQFKVYDDVITQRFGSVPYLTSDEYRNFEEPYRLEKFMTKVACCELKSPEFNAVGLNAFTDAEVQDLTDKERE
jgi:hypothetical protein